MFQGKAIFPISLRRMAGIYNQYNREKGPSWVIFSRYLFLESASKIDTVGVCNTGQCSRIS